MSRSEEPYKPGWLLEAMERKTLVEQMEHAHKERPDHPATVLELLGADGRRTVSDLLDELSTNLVAMSDAVRANDAADLVASALGAAASLDALESLAPEPEEPA